MTDELRGGGATPGALHIVSTPIGNLADLTPRAAAVLREVGLIVAEDTRVSRPMLSSIGVQTEVTALPGFDEADRVAPIIARLQSGTAVALISDAGTPLISDPGGVLVAAAVAAGVICEMRVPLPLTVAIKILPVLPTAKATRSAAVYRPIVAVTLVKLGAASVELSGMTAICMPESVTPTM